MSGAGKSTVLDALEDMGWDCVDNLPTALLEDFVHGERGGAADACRSRSGWTSAAAASTPSPCPDLLRSIEGVTPEILYLDCAGSELDPPLRRDPPPPPAGARPARRGRHRPRARHRPRRCAARPTACIDTTDLTPAELREELRRRYGGDVDQPVLTIVSFGFARGISRTADLVFDMRFVANPHWVDELAAADRRGPGGPRLCRRGPGLDAGDGPDRDAVNRDSFPAIGPPAKAI